jgi:two-component system sensor histidine kinase SenX3
VRHFGTRVAAETKRMGNLVTELIALSRLQGGETAEFATVDVDELVDEALTAAQIPAEAAQISLTSDDSCGLFVYGDRPLLLTALNNLISNAIAYSPAGTVVSVSRRVIEPEDETAVPMVAVSVTDRGIGIEATDQERVFERFFRVDKARSRMTGGTGLGLAIVKHVAANHSGTISVWSRPGTGSTFTLAIPQAFAASDTPAHDPASDPGEKELL